MDLKKKKKATNKYMCVCDEHITEYGNMLKPRVPDHIQRTVMINDLFSLTLGPLVSPAKAKGPLTWKPQTKPTPSPTLNDSFLII